MRDVIAAREKIVKETKLLRMMENGKKKEKTQRNKTERAVKAAMEKANSDTLLEGPSRTITQNIMFLSKACIWTDNTPHVGSGWQRCQLLWNNH